MRKSLKMKVGAIGVTFAMAGALAVVASGTTGAYFSDTRTGGITGTIGNIHVDTIGSAGTTGDHINLAFTNLMPGEPQSVTFKYQNTGPVPEDVFLTFPNVPALHAFNNLGHFGEVHVVDGNNNILFESTNLSDNRPDSTGQCGEFRPTVGLTVLPLPCWPLPPTLRVARNVGPTASGSVTFTFNYLASLGNGSNGATGGLFNSYPSTGAEGPDAEGSGNGLPVNVVAVQVGQTP